MIAICSWHFAGLGMVMGEVEPFGDPRPTHGICTDCAETFKREHMEKKLKQEVARLDALGEMRP